MTASVPRRHRIYWLLATLVLPLANPPLLFALADGLGVSDVALVTLAAAADALVLCPVALWAWEPAKRWWKLGLGFLTTLVLTVPFGGAYLVVLYAIVCGHAGCD